MSGAPDPLPQDFADAFAGVADRLGAVGSTVVFFREVGSTNDVAAALASRGREGAVVIADAQMSGRGRRGHSWFSPAGSGLYVSVVLSPGRARQAADRATGLLTLMAGVALAEAIESATGLGPSIKWPNDLLIDGRKLAGILAEGVTGSGGDGGVQAVVLGYGINVSAAAYPSALATRATSLESELGRDVDRARLCAETLAALAARYEDLLSARFDVILDAWRRRAAGVHGAAVEWDTPDGTAIGTTAGIDDLGALLVRRADRTERVVAGEVRWMKKCS